MTELFRVDRDPDSHASDAVVPTSAAVNPASDLVRAWRSHGTGGPRATQRARGHIDAALSTPDGIEFVRAVLTRVLAVGDPHLAGQRARALAKSVPQSLPALVRRRFAWRARRAALSPAGLDALTDWLGSTYVPLFLADGHHETLPPAVQALRETGARIDAHVVGPPVLGRRAADQRLDEIRGLLTHRDVDAITVDIASLVGPWSGWAFDDAVATCISRLDDLITAASDGAHISVTLQADGSDNLEIALEALAHVARAWPTLSVWLRAPRELPTVMILAERLHDLALVRAPSAPSAVGLRIERDTRVPIERDPVIAWAATWLANPDLHSSVRVSFAIDSLAEAAYLATLVDQPDLDFRWGVSSRAAQAILASPRADAVGRVTVRTPVLAGGQWPDAARYLADLLPGSSLSVRPIGPGLSRPGITRADRDDARAVLAKAEYTQMGSRTCQEASVPGPASLETVLCEARAAATPWAERGSDVRAWLLEQAAEGVDERRAEVAAVLVSDANATFDQANREVDLTIDALNHHARAARSLDAVKCAVATPVRVTAVTSQASTPAADIASSVAAALVTGSSVVVHPSPATARAIAIVLEVLHNVSIDPACARMTLFDEPQVAALLPRHHMVDQVTGFMDPTDADLVASQRPDVRIAVESAGTTCVVVTASGRTHWAISDIVAHGLTGRSAVRDVLYVGPDAEYEQLVADLEDALESLTCAPARDLNAVTTTAIGVARHRADADQNPSVISVQHVGSFEAALEVLSARTSDVAATLYSDDDGEWEQFCTRVPRAHLARNCALTGHAPALRAAWGSASSGPTWRPDGPHYVASLTAWEPHDVEHAGATYSAQVAAVLDAAHTASAHGLISPTALGWLHSAAALDQRAWDVEFGQTRHNIAVSQHDARAHVTTRYQPCHVQIRCEGPLEHALRTLMAAALAQAPVELSCATQLPDDLSAMLADSGVVALHVEPRGAWLRRLSTERPDRVRLIGCPPDQVRVALGGERAVRIMAEPVTAAGRLELLNYVREQTLSAPCNCSA